MKTLNFAISDILESIYASTAVMYLGARDNDRPPVIMHRDHAAALSRVIADAASAVSAAMIGRGVIDSSCDPDGGTVTFTIDDMADASRLRHVIANAIRLMTLHIVYSAAGITDGFLSIAQTCMSVDARHYRPATLTRHDC
ncbi:MAG: hypothetical protein Q4C34_03865 [Bacteroidales bacterium]|nr:hypothetical protein [Bacteroidales bacterium]